MKCCFSRALVLLAVIFVPCSARAADWPQWRGPAGQGHSTANNLPLTWSETENIAWKTPLAGKGWSSPVMDDNTIWVTAAQATPVSEEERKRRLVRNTGDQPLEVVGDLSMRAIAVDRKTGAVRHDLELMTLAEPEPIHALNSYASPTPVLEEGRLYCHFGAYGTACLDTASGKVLWKNQQLAIRHENGPGSSPVLWDKLLMFHCDGSDVQYVVALDKATGEVAWRTARSGKMDPNPQHKKAYGTPLVVEIGGKPVLVSPGADWLYGYEPASGMELWKVPYGKLGFSIVPRPVAGHGLVFMCTSFMQSELLAVRVGGAGASAQPNIAWRYTKSVPQMPSPILVGEELYFVSDKGVATCLDARSGELRWTERLGGNFCSSPLYADGKLFFCSRDGVTTVLAPGAEFKKLAENKLDGSIMASPAAVDEALYLRTEKALYRIQNKP